MAGYYCVRKKGHKKANQLLHFETFNIFHKNKNNYNNYWKTVNAMFVFDNEK